jgi:Asp-tRNA(Asn)/Glu-tRNA(Gln) amidotransferase A subunit family amidase
MSNDSSDAYDLESVQLPYLSGPSLRLFAAVMESSLGSLATGGLFKTAGITWLREQRIDDPPTMRPVHPTGAPPSETDAPATALAAESSPQVPVTDAPGFRFATVRDYAKAYRDGETTPTEVAQRALAAIDAGNRAEPPLRAMIAVDREEVLRQAEEAMCRIRDGQALSVFDGVPVAVKDELDMRPYPTTVGTAFLGQTSAEEDATIVARMRAAGALLIGKANMHEIGIGVTGLNTTHGTPRNPYAPDHYTGGSSSGPAAAVAAGLCPVALGADGGGSIRVPASFCGVVGLKPTFGRLSEHGAAPLCWSVAHVGPLAATVADTALSYAVMAGPDPKDTGSLHQPAPTLAGWDREDLDGLTLGVYWPWFRHATAEVVTRCEAMLATFEGLGARIREVTIPDLEAGRVAHTVTLGGEMAQALSRTYAEHHREHGLDVRINLAMARRFTAYDYVQAQRVRTRMLANFGRVLKDVDVIVTPSTGLVAPPIPEAALRGGESDLSTLIEIMRFATPANMTGLPAISFPVGYSDAGLPVGMQAIGRAWQEPTLLRLALAAEKVVTRREPQWHYQLLP